MSVQAITWAFQQNVKTSTCKFILVCLSNFANDSNRAYPSVQTICGMTGLDRKTVISGLDKLATEGLISDTGQRVGFTKQIRVYELSCPKNGTVPKTEAKSPVFPTKQSRFSVKESQKRDTEPSGTVKEPKGNGKPRYFPREIDTEIERLKEERKQLRFEHAMDHSLNGRTWDCEKHRIRHDVEIPKEIAGWQKQRPKPDL